MQLTADIHTRTRARHFFFFFFLHGPLLHALDGKGTGRGFACVFALCLILYLGWEHVFGGMVLLINILYTLYCTSTRCESTRWVEELSEVFFLPSCILFLFSSFFFCSVSAKNSELCTYTMAEKSEHGSARGTLLQFYKKV